MYSGQVAAVVGAWAYASPGPQQTEAFNCTYISIATAAAPYHHQIGKNEDAISSMGGSWAGPPLCRIQKRSFYQHKLRRCSRLNMVRGLASVETPGSRASALAVRWGKNRVL